MADNFRQDFKFYKRKNPPPSLKEVVDVDKDGFERTLKKVDLMTRDIPKTHEVASSLGLNQPITWQCYTANGFPGFQYIRNPFTPAAQRCWVKRCLADYPCKPHVTNLDALAQGCGVDRPWEASQAKNSGSSQSKEKTLLDQLRWCTLGYHYDWNDKVYHSDHHTPFPGDLGLLSAFIATMLGYEGFRPQAAIVNFYHMDSTLGGHTDHSEFDLTAPLISYSFGQSAILLVGGKTKETKPLALHLRSGDIVILGGESRLAYHAVPKIMYANEGTQLPECFTVPDLTQCSGADEMKRNELSQLHSDLRDCVGVGDQISNNSSAITINCSGDNDDLEKSPQPETDDNAELLNKGSDAMKEAQGGFNPSRDTDGDPGKELLQSFRWCDDQHQETLDRVSSGLVSMSKDEEWNPFESYLKNARINISVRQVTGPGKGFPVVEETSEHCNENKRTKTDTS